MSSLDIPKIGDVPPWLGGTSSVFSVCQLWQFPALKQFPYMSNDQYSAEGLLGTCAVSRVLCPCNFLVFSRRPCESSAASSTQDGERALQQLLSCCRPGSCSNHTAQVHLFSYSRPEGSLLLHSAWNPPPPYLIQILLKVNVTISFLGNRKCRWDCAQIFMVVMAQEWNISQSLRCTQWLSFSKQPHYVAQVGLELCYSCFHHLSAAITCMCHLAWLIVSL